MAKILKGTSLSSAAPISAFLDEKQKKEFSDIRHKLIALQMKDWQFSKYSRDIHFISDLLFYAEMDDFFKAYSRPLKENDPRGIYFYALQKIRKDYESPLEIEEPIDKNTCNIELSLFLLQKFHMNLMAKQPTNEGALKFILDIRRIALIAEVSKSEMIMGIKDYGEIYWEKEQPHLKNTFDSWMKGRTSAHKSADEILQSVSKFIPSRADYETENQSETADKAQRHN